MDRRGEVAQVNVTKKGANTTNAGIHRSDPGDDAGSKPGFGFSGSSGIQSMFSKISRNYELVNHVLTLGMDVRWRLKAVSEAIASGRARFLDVCTGTGETASYIARTVGSKALVIGIDFSIPMMLAGRKKRGKTGVDFVAASAWKIPFCSETFDVVTISFAARNLAISRADLVAAYAEMRRVLRPGGILANLESSQPSSHALRVMFHAYASKVVPFLGKIFSRAGGGAYRYLSSTLCSFYDARELESILLEAGFSRVRYELLNLGIAALHIATR